MEAIHKIVIKRSSLIKASLFQNQNQKIKNQILPSKISDNSVCIQSSDGKNDRPNKLVESSLGNMSDLKVTLKIFINSQRQAFHTTNFENPNPKKYIKKRAFLETTLEGERQLTMRTEAIM